MALEIRLAQLSPVTDVRPRNATILTPDQARACVDSGGVIDPVAGCVHPDGGGGNGDTDSASFEVKPWMWVAGGVAVLGLAWYFTRQR